MVRAEVFAQAEGLVRDLDALGRKLEQEMPGGRDAGVAVRAAAISYQMLIGLCRQLNDKLEEEKRHHEEDRNRMFAAMKKSHEACSAAEKRNTRIRELEAEREVLLKSLVVVLDGG